MTQFGSYDEHPFLAELYDFVPRYRSRSDLEFYLELARQSEGKILELGCGTGRVLLPIAEAGAEIVGIDLSPSMLAQCGEKLKSRPEAVQRRVLLVQADITDFELEKKFSTIIIPFRPFQHLLSISAQLACLGCAHRHLQPGGLLAFDLFQVNFGKLADLNREEETEDFSDLQLPGGRELRRCFRIVNTHRAEQYNDVEMIYYLTDSTGKTQRLVQAFPFRYFFRYEVEHLLARAGFELVALYGDFDRSPLQDDSPEMLFLARKPG